MLHESPINLSYINVGKYSSPMEFFMTLSGGHFVSTDFVEQRNDQAADFSSNNFLTHHFPKKLVFFSGPSGAKGKMLKHSAFSLRFRIR